MEIQTQTTQTTTSTTTPPAAADDGTISSDFETFLTLLVAQLENQDPLNPVESDQFAVQLATFSNVEQQTLTNDLLRDIAGDLGSGSTLSQLADWVGMDARVNAPAWFDQTPITLAPEVAPGADGATLVVRDVTGTAVSREAMPVGSETLVWAGVGPDGTPLPAGYYTFEVENLSQGSISSVSSVDHYARVVEARTGTDGIDLVLRGGEVVPATDVTALRSPETPL